MPQNPNSNQNLNNRNTAIKYLIRQAAKPFTFLLIFIMICAFLVHYLNDSETLQEYAENNPELAYGKSAEMSDSPDELSSRTTEYLQGSENEIPHKDTDSSADSAVSGKDDSSGAPDTMTDKGTPARSSAYNNSESPESDAADNTDIDTQQSKTDGQEIKEQEDMITNPERTIYHDGFYYEPLSEEIKQRITGISYPETGCTVPYEDLNYVGLLYVDFNGEVQEGELICNKAIAQDMVEIFYELFQNDYRIERVRLIDEYGGDDTLSMEDNNTSCFNYRVVDGTTSLSKHALGCAIDINPFYNPYVVYNKSGNGDTYISPKGSEAYADRSQNFPYKIDENDLCYKLFTAHGFTWGGNWNSLKDYQHFQIVL